MTKKLFTLGILALVLFFGNGWLELEKAKYSEEKYIYVEVPYTTAQAAVTTEQINEVNYTTTQPIYTTQRDDQVACTTTQSNFIAELNNEVPFITTQAIYNSEMNEVIDENDCKVCNCKDCNKNIKKNYKFDVASKYNSATMKASKSFGLTDIAENYYRGIKVASKELGVTIEILDLDEENDVYIKVSGANGKYKVNTRYEAISVFSGTIDLVSYEAEIVEKMDDFVIFRCPVGRECGELSISIENFYTGEILAKQDVEC